MARNVRMHGNFISGEIVIDEKASARIDDKLFRKRSPNAHGHRANDLAPGSDRVKDAAGRTHGQHAPNAALPGDDIHTHLDEVRAEG